jgi:hypothetical protein
MRSALTVAAIILAIPLLFIATLYARGGKFIVVQNSGNADIAVSAMDASGAYIESTESRTVRANGLTWIIFFPQLNGALSLRCIDRQDFRFYSIGPGNATSFMFSKVTLNGCGKLLKQWSS